MTRHVPVAALTLVAAATLSACAAGSTGERAVAVSQHGAIVRVVDGDTLVIDARGSEQRVRLLGIDTPESVRPGTPVECGAKAAFQSLRRLAPAGARAQLTTDPASGDDRDEYGRVLAFVVVHGRDVGLTQVRRGWAQVFAYRDREFSRRGRYEHAADNAAQRRLGVHERCASTFHGTSGTR
jgi:micrococcal nuclease